MTGTTFTAAANQLWFRQSYTAATPSPTSTPGTPTPSPSPTTTPSPQPVFVYQGSYTVVHNHAPETNGCAFLVTTQDGSPLSGLNANAANSDFPTFNQNVNTTPVANGFVTSLTVNNLSATGGSGTLSLDDGSTGTITLTSRTAFPRLSAAQFLMRHH